MTETWREIVRQPYQYRPEREGTKWVLAYTSDTHREAELVGGEMVIRVKMP